MKDYVLKDSMLSMYKFKFSVGMRALRGLKNDLNLEQLQWPFSLSGSCSIRHERNAHFRTGTIIVRLYLK